MTVVKTGDMATCSFGASPSPLKATLSSLLSMGTPALTVMDFTLANIPTFGMCSSLSNPSVASATASALGMLTPMPCIPNIISPWSIGHKKLKLKGLPVLTDADKTICLWGGVVTVSMALGKKLV